MAGIRYGVSAAARDASRNCRLTGSNAWHSNSRTVEKIQYRGCGPHHHSDRCNRLRSLHGLGDRGQRCREFDGDVGRCRGRHRRRRHPDRGRLRVPRGISGRRRGHLHNPQGDHRRGISRARSGSARRRNVVGAPGGRDLVDDRVQIRLASVDHALDSRGDHRIRGGCDRIRGRPLVGRDDNRRKLGRHSSSSPERSRICWC